MAPEQFRGAPPDARTDLFALGAVLFEMLTANRAFPGDTLIEIYHKTMYEQPPALAGSESVAVLDRVIRRALSKRPEDRYQSASEMAEALSKAVGVADAGEAPRAHALTRLMVLPSRMLRVIRRALSKRPEDRYQSASEMAETLSKAVGVADAGEAPRAHALTRLMVLPFRMLRPDEHTEFLAFSVPDAVTNALTGLESLVIRSSAAASRFGGDNPDFKKIAEEADVDAVLIGTLLRAGERLRVNVQLLKVPDGTVLWSHAPQVTMRDVFQLQDQIVEHIVESLSLSLTAREHKRLKRDVPASPTAYEFFLRGNELVAPQGLGSASNLRVARDLYSRTVEEDPRYAPAWARLGRCHWLIWKGGEDKEENVRRAEECFEKALELNPELPLAHNLYALLEIDQGRAQDAMTRLVHRALVGSAQPELYASLVQACRFCGLLEASVAAHERACELDRNVTTSVYHTHWQLGDDERSLQTIVDPVYIDALILGMRGNESEAIQLLRDREQRKLPEMMRSMLSSLRALFEGHREECVEEAERIIAAFPDPEFVYYVSRHLAYFAENERALVELGKVLDRGFVCYRMLIREDPWLDSLRSAPGFKELLEGAKARYQEALGAYVEAGGERLLGVSVPT